MVAPVTSAAPIRLVKSAVSQEVCAGVTSCGPLLQHELLKAIRHQAPQIYLRVSKEFRLTLEKTQATANRGEVVSAARAIQFARLIAHESNGSEMFSEAGANTFLSLYQELPYSLKLVNLNLPRPLRLRLALAIAQRLAHSFAGGRGRVLIHRHHGRLYLAVIDGLFADRMDTLIGAHEFYRSFLETMLRKLARVKCQVQMVRRARVRLHECCFEIAWEA